MAKPLDEIVRDVLGNLVLENAKLQAEIGQLKERIAQLETPVNDA